MKTDLTTILILLLITGSTAQASAQNKETFYSNTAIGWTMEHPENWTVITPQDNKDFHMRSLRPMRNEDEVTKNFDNFLVGYQKNDLNSFEAIAKKWSGPDHDSWLAMSKKSKIDMFLVIQDNGIAIDSTATKIVRIDQVDFQHYEFRIYDRKDTVIFSQQIYRSLINGYNLGVNIKYSNELDKKRALNSWLNSKFEK